MFGLHLIEWLEGKACFHAMPSCHAVTQENQYALAIESRRVVTQSQLGWATISSLITIGNWAGLPYVQIVKVKPTVSISPMAEWTFLF